MSSSSYHNTKGAMYFVHLHIVGQAKCMWYSETKDKFGVHPDVLFAHACNREDANQVVFKLGFVGVAVQEAILIPCDSSNILTTDMQRVLNLA
jgi:hypothetical protein